MPKRRVVITGIGLVSALGESSQDYLKALWENNSGIKRIGAFDPVNFTSQVAGESPALRMAKLVPKAHRKATKLMSRDIELAVVAADDAVRDAQLKTKGTAPEEPADIEPTRSGVNIGAGLICCDIPELAAAIQNGTENDTFSYGKWGREGMATLTPLWLLKYLPNMLSCHVSIIHDLQGPSNAVTCAEASGLLAVGEAFRLISNDKADVIVAGGAECKVNPMALLRQCLLKRVSTKYNDTPEKACRPFDSQADGTVVGEGAGIVVLEELQHAQKRGAPIYAEITGYGASFECGPDYVAPSSQGKGIALAITKALAESKLDPDKIDMLIPHGASVPSHDLGEVNGIKTAFGAAASKLPIFAVKSRVGNCGAGAAAIDLVTAALLMKHNKIPANLNCDQPAADLNIINQTTETELNNVMTSCYTYGGQTAAMVLSKI
ncbi:MAG: beta-ketoacyl-[acyl-carrier-protein] synthase family protein [Sedimentisphaerales bacterium]|nr:beta-ketoacyl-[acyl-carrier-protein] synthase family protein [Sedimentisphaerales bacterium]